MLVRVTTPHYVAGLVIEEDKVIEAAPILRWAIGHTTLFVRQRLGARCYQWELVPEQENMMKCLVCGSDQMKGHVRLSYDLPLGAREGSIKMGNTKLTKIDIRDAWEKLERRPIWCTGCHAMYVWDTKAQKLVAVDEW